jgi:hypothetical protein
MRLCLTGALVLLLASGSPLGPSAALADSDWDPTFGGHIKARAVQAWFPDNSLFRKLGESSTATDISGEARLKFSANRRRWDFKADYQFIALYGDTLELARELPGAPVPINQVINDDRRWFNLTDSIVDEDRRAVIQRLDRLSVGYTTEHSVWRFGRQAISWGNGLLFTPMDVFNPFDPAAVDKEYKTGDDMLYGQFLFGNGNDLQGTAIVRRDPRTGEVEKDQSSLAFKYHGFAGMNEYDLLAAEHYDDQIFGFGGNVSVGGAVLRGDLTWTRTALDEVLSLVVSASYSWVWGGKNVSGVLEYYYNGFGQANGDYSAASLARNPDLLRRVERGELFTLGRNYLAASATIEINPLFMVIPNAFINLDDPSALAQMVFQYDWKQNLQVLGALNLPVGPDGTEYGGLPTTDPLLFLSTDASLFAQLAWYF